MLVIFGYNGANKRKEKLLRKYLPGNSSVGCGELWILTRHRLAFISRLHELYEDIARVMRINVVGSLSACDCSANTNLLTGKDKLNCHLDQHSLGDIIILLFRDPYFLRFICLTNKRHCVFMCLQVYNKLSLLTLNSVIVKGFSWLPG